MLDKSSEKVLRFVTSLLKGEAKLVLESEVSEHFKGKLSNKELALTIEHLEKTGYIKIRSLQRHNSKCYDITMSPTKDGYCYFEMKRKNFVHRVMTPIVVSVITNLIIIALKWLLPPIIQWIASSLL